MRARYVMYGVKYIGLVSLMTQTFIPYHTSARPHILAFSIPLPVKYISL